MMENQRTNREIKNQLIYIVENANLSLRSRIDLKKEIRENKITNRETLSNRIKEIEEEGITEPIEEHDDEKESRLKSIVINSKLKRSYKNYYIKKIKDGDIADEETLMKQMKEDEEKLKFLSILKKSGLESKSKNEIKKQINKKIISDYKTLYKEIKKASKIEETKDSEKYKAKLIRILNRSKLDDFSKSALKRRIKLGEIKDEESLKIKIEEMKNYKETPIRYSKPKNPSPVIISEKGYSEDYRYFKDLYG